MKVWVQKNRLKAERLFLLSLCLCFCTNQLITGHATDSFELWWECRKLSLNLKFSFCVQSKSRHLLLRVSAARIPRSLVNMLTDLHSELQLKLGGTAQKSLSFHRGIPLSILLLRKLDFLWKGCFQIWSNRCETFPAYLSDRTIRCLAHPMQRCCPCFCKLAPN